MPAKSLRINFIPVSLLKGCVGVLSPVIDNLANLSFPRGTLFDKIQSAQINPSLKNVWLHPDDLGQTYFEPQCHQQCSWASVSGPAAPRWLPHMAAPTWLSLGTLTYLKCKWHKNQTFSIKNRHSKFEYWLSSIHNIVLINIKNWYLVESNNSFFMTR